MPGWPIEHAACSRRVALGSALQQALLELPDFWCGRGAQLVAEPLAKFFVDPQRFGAVAARGEDLHQQRVSAFAVWRELDQFACAAFAGRELRPADAERDSGVALERADMDLTQALAVFVGPREVLVGQEAPPRREHRDQGWSPPASPVLLRDGGFGAMDRFLGGFQVDPRIGWELQRNLAAAAQHVAAEDGAKPGQKRAQCGVGTAWLAVWPQRFDQPVARGRQGASDGQVGEQHSRLSARKLRRELPPVELYGQAPAELDSSRLVVAQGRCKENRRSVQTCGRSVALDVEEMVMAKVIRCQCGFLGRGETVEEAAAVIEAHMREDHPELIGKVTRADLVAMAEEA